MKLLLKVLLMACAGMAAAGTLLILLIESQGPDIMADEAFYACMVALPALALGYLAWLWRTSEGKSDWSQWVLGAFLAAIVVWLVIEIVL